MTLLVTALAGTISASSLDAGTLITTYEELRAAVSEAKDGDTLYVSDIDFTPSSPDVYKSVMQIDVKKSLTIKSGKADGAAVFTNGVFQLKGSKVSGEKIVLNFDHIVFDGCVDTKGLTAYNYPDEGFYGHALNFVGNVEATFESCEFKNYTSPSGAVLEIRYDDYTANEALVAMYQDQSNCRLDLAFNNCTIKDNAAFYTGGAFYIEANNNVTLKMTNSTLADNKSGAVWGMGGGAVYAKGLDVEMLGCNVAGNCANYVYEGMESYISEDKTRGGALYLLDCTLNMRDCKITENAGSMGGGIALTETSANFDGCVFSRNRAERCSAAKALGVALPWDSMAQGGALYTDGRSGKTISFINSCICENTAEVAFGGTFQYYTGYQDESFGVNYLKFTLCTYANNICLSDDSYDFADPEKLLWGEMPGDIWTEPNTTAKGCIIIDRYFDSAFPKNEKPSDSNGYNYFASPAQAEADGIQMEKTDVLSVKLPKGDTWTIPNDFFAALVGDRYDGKLTSGTVGSNYKETLYRNGNGVEKEQSGLWLYVGIGAAVLVLIIVAVVLMTRRSRGAAFAERKIPIKEEPTDDLISEDKERSDKQTINAKYTDEQIEKLTASMPEVHTLTDREREVFLEILRGKKLGEISAELYISDSTVKNFYQKIYSKMGVTSKDMLLQKIFEEAKKL